MQYEFKCDCKEEQPIIKVIDKPVSAYYVPGCPNCGKPMKRVYGVNVIAGTLDRANLPK